MVFCLDFTFSTMWDADAIPRYNWQKNLACIAIFCVKIQEKVSFLLQSYTKYITVDNQLQKWIRISHLGKSIAVFHVNEIIVNF